MDASKFSNFTIDYILRERTGSLSHTDSSSASQTFQEDISKVSLPSESGFNAQASGVPVMAFPAPCPGIYDTAGCYNTIHCCGPVTYYQTNFNMGYPGGEHWFHAQPGKTCTSNRYYVYLHTTSTSTIIISIKQIGKQKISAQAYNLAVGPSWFFYRPRKYPIIIV